ncbi:hypothetical protein OH76DRAFT_1490894 [Lentinus brumalis]|uniref:Uncharacterized protein n=1 Tax=Lentinus brumalis TaxID=2498619 RepID=A0A371CHF0_9APHY|nr:hypothetical protein OH76DRAFT_1490894 [Polyporus brumalis]
MLTNVTYQINNIQGGHTPGLPQAQAGQEHSAFLPGSPNANSIGPASASNIGQGMHVPSGESEQNLNLGTSGGMWMGMGMGMGMGMDGLMNYNVQGLGSDQRPLDIARQNGAATAETTTMLGQYTMQWPGNGTSLNGKLSNPVLQGAGLGGNEPAIVVTNTQLQEIIKAAVKAELAEINADNATERAELARETYWKDKRTQIIKVPAAVKHAVHQTMLRLMGCLHKNKRSLHAGVPTYFDLPDPLPEGEPKRTVGSGQNVVTLWNPDWFRPVDEGVNVDYIAATVNSVVQSGSKFDVTSA